MFTSLVVLLVMCIFGLCCGTQNASNLIEKNIWFLLEERRKCSFFHSASCCYNLLHFFPKSVMCIYKYATYSLSLSDNYPKIHEKGQLNLKPKQESRKWTESLLLPWYGHFVSMKKRERVSLSQYCYKFSEI